MQRNLARRAISMAVDVFAHIGAWIVVALVVTLGLSALYPDNPWGNLAFALLWGFPVALILSVGEAVTGQTPGRTVTGLRLCGATDGNLTTSARWIRAVLKPALVLGLLWLGQAMDTRGEEGLRSLVPLLCYVVLNAAACSARTDGLSLLDLTVGSESRRLARASGRQD